MRQLDIVMAVIKQEDLYHFQFRNGPKQIGAAGMIGCFGGKIEDEETPLQAIMREVAEETNLYPVEEDLRYVGEVNVESDNNLEPVKIHSMIFKYMVDSSVTVEAREGELVSLDSKRIKIELDTMTPSTRACFETLIKKI